MSKVDTQREVVSSQCVDHICTAGFITLVINIFEIDFGRFSFQFQLKIPNQPKTNFENLKRNLNLE